MSMTATRSTFWILATFCALALGAAAVDGEQPPTPPGPERVPVGVLKLHGCVSGVRMGSFEPSTLAVEVGPLVRRYELREGLALDDLAVLIQDDFAKQAVRVTTVGADALVFGLPSEQAEFGIDGNDRTLRCTIELSRF